MSKVNGLAARNNGNIFINKNKCLVDDLDKLPYVDYSLLEDIDIKKQVNIDVGRGCPFSCTFCSTSIFWKRRYRLKSKERLIEEMELEYK